VAGVVGATVGGAVTVGPGLEVGLSDVVAAEADGDADADADVA
jgi:hypothetical protein